MSEDSTQLSVAELLARNGQGAPASGGGGRRRRSGRGIGVNEFTGDMPVVREGGSSHAAPEEPAGYDAPPSPDPALAYSATPESDYSPLSGPIAFYDPLAPSGSSPSESPGYSSTGFGVGSFGSGGYESGSSDLGSGYGATDFGSPGVDRSYRAPEPNGREASADPFGSPRAAQPTPGGRRARRELAESLAAQDDSYADPFGSAPVPEVPSPGGGGRRRRREPDEQLTEVQPFRGPQGLDAYAPGPDSRGLNGFAPGPDSRGPGANSFGPDSRGPGPNSFGPDSRGPGGPPFGPGADSRGPGANAFAPGPNSPAPNGNSFSPGPDGWGPPRGPEPMAQPGRAPDLDRGEPGPAPRMGRRNGADGPPPPGGLPAWSARRRAPADFPPPPDRNGGEPPRNGAEVPSTAVWSLANQGKPGPGPVGDPREDLDYRRGGRPLPSDPLPRDVRPVTDLLAVDVHGRTEIYPAVGPDFDPIEDDDLDLDYDEDEEDLLDFDDEDEEDDDFDERPVRRARRSPGRSSRDRSLSVRSKALLQGDRPQWLSFGGGQESERRQWLVLAGQVVGAAVAGMLLFKGFEKMWDLLPFVALALAVVVILGLVALVRVLRRTDDMYSTVIAVVVGIFVTLGPLAFLLSTN
ncbi:hypothetical protein [Nocardia vaccinii]|uniref:hypothetical protein n=1 Tax=Nocardia vaccinii TaxID=1822 RepID=UPI000834CC3B